MIMLSLIVIVVDRFASEPFEHGQIGDLPVIEKFIFYGQVDAFCVSVLWARFSHTYLDLVFC
jgi:hypothetical protein